MTSSSDSPSYPPPPWDTHAEGAGSVYLVSAKTVRLPTGFRPVAALGKTSGMLAYLRYLAPSPLEYQELIWIPAMVRAGGQRGWFVDKIYVDNEASLAAGRTEWALPKTLAQFDREGDRVTVTAEDGTFARLRLRRFGPAQRMRSRLATLQAEGAEVVRFTCSFSGQVQLGGLTVESFSPGGDGWPSFVSARSTHAGGTLAKGRARMHAAQRLGGRLDGE
ncbi:MAG: acetoacetate decarboxylase family protein [Deltaproteobacteria bacterium]|nr:acetoacetate decarboxylase family protein [Deltaproteobacteria bacterium]